MKAKNKGKVEYVEEFRKITAIEKLPTLKEGFGDIFFGDKAENNKFLRLKDEPSLNEIQLNYKAESFCENEFVQGFIYDCEEQCKASIQQHIHWLNEEIESYNKWARELTQQIQQPKYVYRFKNQKASPPIALSKQILTVDPLAIELANDSYGKGRKPTKSTNLQSHAAEAMNLPNKQPNRFNFHEITDYLITDDYKFEDLDGNIDMAKKQIELFRQFKHIADINQIDELKVDYDKFEYHISEQPEHVEKKRYNDSDINSFAFKNNSSFAEQQSPTIDNKKNHEVQLPKLLKQTKTPVQKFKYLSILKDNLEIDINFFRDLGPPSRNSENFILNIVLEKVENNILDEEDQNPFVRQKIDTCLLHYLEPVELKIDKANLSFYDIHNISMARITSTNAHMCIRSEKVTRLQYQKLLKKMEKLYKMQHEDGKTRVHQAVSTDELQDDVNHKGSKTENSQNKLSIHRLVEEINMIRKEAFSLNKDSERSFKLINQRLLNDELSKKMFTLLEELYKKVCDELPFQYSILEIGLHVDQINGLAEEYYQKKKLIWFIMTVLEQIEKGKSLEKNLSYLQNKNRKDDEPRVIKYKGQKILAKDKIGTKNLYYNNPTALSTVRDRSVGLDAKATMSKLSPVPKNSTPIKNISTSKSPLKNTTSSKSPLKDNPRPPFKTGAKSTTPTKKDAWGTPGGNRNSEFKESTAKKTGRF